MRSCSVTFFLDQNSAFFVLFLLPRLSASSHRLARVSPYYITTRTFHSEIWVRIGITKQVLIDHDWYAYILVRCRSPLASAMASEPRFVLLFKFLNWSSFSNLSARVRLTQVVFFGWHTVLRRERVENHQYWCLSINIFSSKNAFWFHCGWIVFQCWRGRPVAWLASGPQMIKNFNIFQENLREGDFHEKVCQVTTDRSRTCYCISYRRQPRTSLIITRILQI